MLQKQAFYHKEPSPPPPVTIWGHPPPGLLETFQERLRSRRGLFVPAIHRPVMEKTEVVYNSLQDPTRLLAGRSYVRIAYGTSESILRRRESRSQPLTALHFAQCVVAKRRRGRSATASRRPYENKIGLLRGIREPRFVLKAASSIQTAPPPPHTWMNHTPARS